MAEEKKCVCGETIPPGPHTNPLLHRGIEVNINQTLGKRYPHLMEYLKRAPLEALSEMLRLTRDVESEIINSDRRSMRKLSQGRLR